MATFLTSNFREVSAAFALASAAFLAAALAVMHGGDRVAAQDAPPSRPTGLSVTATPGSLEVLADWDDMAGATFYAVHWRYAAPITQLHWRVEVQSSQAAATMPSAGEWTVKVEACNNSGCGPGELQKFRVERALQPPARLAAR